MLLGYMAHGNHGTTIHLTDKTTKHPRKQLLKALGRQHTSKVYCDTKAGSKHIGYIVGGEWFTLYEVHSWNSKR